VIHSTPSLAARLAHLTDPRAARGRRHAWLALLHLVVVGLLAGANTQRALARFAHNLPRTELRRLGFRRPPSQPTLHRFFTRISLAEVEALVSAWTAPSEDAPADPAQADWSAGIAIDGKVLRTARHLGAEPSYLLAARDSKQGTVLAQCAVPSSTNELGAFDRLLAQLKIAGRTVTIDAAFTQWTVATAIVQQGGAYLMVVKGNQPTLRRDIAEAMGHRGRCTGHVESTRAGHGRIERRSLWVAPALAVRQQVIGFPGAHQIMELQRQVIIKRTGQVREETVYGVTSLRANQADARTLLRLWQSHWGIENSVHWVRDVVFGEDQSLTRSGEAPQVLAAFRNLALSWIRRSFGSTISAAREYYVLHLPELFDQLGISSPSSPT
jgi:predicted transposase YbfD/YdcC